MKRRRNRYFIYIVTTVLLASMAFIYPQADLVKRLETGLNTFRTQYAPEKVYVQTNKPYYAPGEAVWMKAYIVNAATLRPSAKSRVLYVDLLNEFKKPVQRLTLKAENGKANGDIILPNKLAEGSYILVAYTHWMRNFGEDAFFSKTISVLGANKQAGNRITPAVSQDLDFQFFPEGGDMVQGLTNRIAFKATGPAGTGIAVRGSIFDDRGQKLLDFKDMHLGMGAFTLQPQAGRSYIARIKTQEGKSLEYALPAAKARGYVLRIDATADGKNLLVNVSGNTNQSEPLVLTGISQDALRYSQPLTLQQGQMQRLEIPTSALPTGIARFNLARSNGEPLAERLVFVDHQDDLEIMLSTDKKAFGNREQVTLQLEARDINGKPVATDLSLAITDAELVKQDEHSLDIKSYLLLTSDLRGYVEQPGYYFESNDPKRKEALQYLLMTQGWRRFSWEEMVSGTFPSIQYPRETALSIRGKIITNKGKPVENAEALLYLRGQHLAFITTETNKQGEFAFNGFDFSGNVEMVVQATDAKGRREHLQVVMEENNFLPNLPFHPNPQTKTITAATKQEFLQASKQLQAAPDSDQTYTLRGILLPEVEIKGEKDIVEPFKLHQKADVVINAKELPVAPSGNILESLQGRVAGLQIYRSGPNQFRASIRGQQSPPLYLLDGMPISESTLMAINQFDISRVEILKNAASSSIYGGRAGGGVIALFTKRGGEELEEVRPGTYIIVHQAKGFSKVREFYSPRYEGQHQASKEPDLRTTIYWNPFVRTDANGKATVTFFTTDRNTTYRAIVEGITENGRPGNAMLTFDVNGKTTNR
jgi:hypothetical protein